MRLLFLLSLILLFSIVAGCTPSHQSLTPNISMLSPQHHDAFIEDNKTVEKISFLLRNNEQTSIECAIQLSIMNETDSSDLDADVGILEPHDLKNISLTFSMLEGNADLSIKPVCSYVYK